jgi:hypothetical protein
VIDILIIIYVLLRSTIFLFPRSTTTSAILPPQNRKKLAQIRGRGRRRGISLRGHRIYHIAVHVVVELAIIRGIRRTALYRGLIKSVFLIYFYLYIIFNITLLLKHQDSLSIYTYNIANSFTFNQCQWHRIKAKNQGVHKAAVVIWLGGHAIQRFAFWGLSDIIGP